MRSGLTYFRFAFLFTAIGLGLAGLLGQMSNIGPAKAVFLCLVLAILEISLSFDNAVVNASVLGRMTPRWRRRFLTWGILFAVFGVRLLFPLMIHSVVSNAHLSVDAFGGVFLLMVGLRHFMSEPRGRWLKPIENALSKLGRLPFADVITALAIIGVLAPFTKTEFLYAGLAGLLIFLIVDQLAHLLDQNHKHVRRASAGLFIYLEVLDASFSFDGVISAFAITTNLFLITLGLGIGAFYVRSLTMLLVVKGSLKEFKYIEQGAFWAVLSLAIIMFVSVFTPVPELITGLIGASLIGASFWSSLKARHQGPLKAKSL